MRQGGAGVLEERLDSQARGTYLAAWLLKRR